MMFPSFGIAATVALAAASATPTLCSAFISRHLSSRRGAMHMAAFQNRQSYLLVRGGGDGNTSSRCRRHRRNSSMRATVTETTGVAYGNEESTTTATSAMQQMTKKLEEITQLGRAQAVLSYDQMVFMPANAAAERGAQLATLASIMHDKKTCPELLELMETASLNQADLTEDDKRIIELERKAFVENQRIPSELAGKAASLSASAYQDWVQAKEAKDFQKFVPTLQQCFDTAIAMTKAKLGDNPDNLGLYDKMLDEFEVGMSQDRIDEIFAHVQGALVPLIEKVLASPTVPSSKPLKGCFDITKQRQLSETLVKAIGFDPDFGRIDVSVHPFTMSMSAQDVRITSRFRDDEWYQGLAGSIHEGGHAIYEQNLKPSALSIDTALSMGTHESQSLFWERHIGLSMPFWKFAHPFVKELDKSFQQYSPRDLYGAVNRVSQSLIRVEADELTYPLHVILRYNIEKDVIGGKLTVKDISEQWNKDMKELLKVDVPSDDKGALQDVHWSGLAFGYFPTYLVGSIAAAQLYHYCARDVPDIESKIETGDFQPIKEWLREKVHQHGRRHESLDAMFQDQLGEPLNPMYFIDYLTHKYTDLYQL